MFEGGFEMFEVGFGCLKLIEGGFGCLKEVLDV
jgi:hypothetical protein